MSFLPTILEVSDARLVSNSIIYSQEYDALFTPVSVALSRHALSKFHSRFRLIVTPLSFI